MYIYFREQIRQMLTKVLLQKKLHQFFINFVKTLLPSDDSMQLWKNSYKSICYLAGSHFAQKTTFDYWESLQQTTVVSLRYTYV